MKKNFALLVMLLLSTAALASERLPFMQDDYPKALKEAHATNRPIFVEVWAPW